MTELPTRQRRGLGIAALVLSLSPAAIAVVVFIATIVAGVAEASGSTALGWLVVGLVVTGVASILLGGSAIVLGIVAVVKRRGRGFGIAAMSISVIGILIALPFFLTFSL